MNGWITLYRQFLDWEWFDVDEMVRLFIFLLLSANHDDGEWRGNKIKRGQLITGINSIHEKTGISHQTIRTCLKRLEKTGEINRQTNNLFSVITICKYDEYQPGKNGSNNRDNKQLTSDQQATNKQLTTNNNDNNDNNENNINTFEKFRLKYPGTKRGLKTEFENFVKKTKDYKSIINILESNLYKQIMQRETLKANGEFVPQWKNLQTYINNRGWEEEYNAKPKLRI